MGMEVVDSGVRNVNRLWAAAAETAQLYAP
jgi:hypothetical protein